MAANWQEKLRRALEENSAKFKQQAEVKRRVVETLEVNRVLKHIVEICESEEYPLLSASLAATQIGTLNGIANKARGIAEQKGWFTAWTSSQGLLVTDNSIELSAQITFVHPGLVNLNMSRGNDQVIRQDVNILAVRPIVRENDVEIELEFGPLNLPKDAKPKSWIQIFKYPGEIGTPDELAMRAIGMIVPHE